jgi:histidinol-phosphate/aromatic aminotransferase/cobyric acid decarboxylase-like protein
LKTICTQVRIPQTSKQTKTLEDEISYTLSIPTSHVKLGKSSVNLLKSLFTNQKERVGILVPDYFEFQDIKGTLIPIMRSPGYRVPKIITELDAIILSNPNNPTGTFCDLDELNNYSKEKGVLLVVDEAYIEFIGQEKSMVKHIKDNHNLVVLRTCSKIYGTSGVGYAMAQPSLLDKIHDSSPDNRLVEQVHSRYTFNHSRIIKDINERREILYGILSTITDEIIPSVGNFVMCKGITQLMDEINVKVVDLNTTPGLRGQGYSRVAVASYKQLEELARRLEHANSAGIH